MAPGPDNVHQPLALDFCGVPMDSPIVLLSGCVGSVSYTHLTLPTKDVVCRYRWSPYH